MKYIDKNLGINLVGIERIYYNFLEAFAKNYRDYPKILVNVFADKNQYHLKIHSLKGIAKNLGSNLLFELCHKIENNLDSQELLNEFIDIFPKILAEIEKVIEERELT